MYDGPVIDAHTHLWNLARGSYPWLRMGSDFGSSRLDPLRRRDYGIDEYRADIAGTGVVASVHIEALWDPDDGAINETRWLDALPRDDAIISRYVAGVAFGTDATADDVAAQAAHERVVGVRQVIAWTPDPAVRMAPRAGMTRDPRWREGVAALVAHDLSLDLLMYPDQADDVCELARDVPELRIVVDHLGSPIRQDADGLAAWRAGVAAMAEHPNVVIKLSAAAAYLIEKTPAGIAPFAAHLVEAFGSSRVMFGSDFPVGSLVGWSYADYLDAYRASVAHLDRTAQEDVFWRTAARVYRMAPPA